MHADAPSAHVRTVFATKQIHMRNDRYLRVARLMLSTTRMNYRLGILGLAILMLSGCHANLYSTPRTVPTGKTQHIVAVDVEDYSSIPAMVYIARRGLADRVDMGFTVSSTLGLDLKINAVRTEYFDLAVDPSVSAAFISMGVGGHEFFTAAVPVIMGLNLHQRMTLVAQAGPAISNYDGTSVFARIGGGLQIRATDLVMIQPEFTAQFIEPDKPLTTIGIGFGFGPQPKYDAPRD